MTSIYLIRHADYASGPLEGSGPRVDLGLTEAGRDQAEALRQRFATSREIAPRSLYASTLPRAVQTAEIIAGAFGLPVQTNRDLEEWRSGNDDTPQAEFLATWHRLSDRDRQFHRFVAGAETAIEFSTRVQSALHRIVLAHAGASAVLVVHGGIIEVAFRYFQDSGEVGLRRARPACGHTSIAHWRRDEEFDEWVLECSNDLQHLRPAP
jgi:probable phosphoglycerate mutase